MKKFKLLLGLSLAASVIAPLAAISCVNEDTNPPVNGGNKTNNPEENTGSTTNNNPSTSGDSTGSTDTNPNPGSGSSSTENSGSSSTGESTGSTAGGETSTPSTDTNPNPGSGSSSTENPGVSGESTTTPSTEGTTQPGTESPVTGDSSSSTEKPTETPTEEETPKEPTLKEKYDKAKDYFDKGFLDNANSSTLEQAKTEIVTSPTDSPSKNWNEELDKLISEGTKNQDKNTQQLVTNASYLQPVLSAKGKEELKKLNEIKTKYQTTKVASQTEFTNTLANISSIIREIQKAEKENKTTPEQAAEATKSENKTKLTNKLNELKELNKTAKNDKATKLIKTIEDALANESSTQQSEQKKGIDLTSTNTVESFIRTIDTLINSINKSSSTQDSTL
ncbi:Uncharacterised protein [Mycoplasmopsis meleagridis]|uniref:hypothetical protein n=1 Tax=Mycoplasmopsis meleagridis TaxID=29561 RepID=UPI0010051D68|nr:hypothetical protein [Mycoplasmopsis meleagridis]VEU77340.1 Uncharacterised protein [Mycoplasmopsis meleagridis]